MSFTGGADWGYRRMVLHYAHLCKAAGGVDAFIIGSEMRGLTTIRDGASSYPAVAALKTLATDVRAILGAGVKIGYAADWSEYFGHQPADGSGDVFFHLDPLWADADIDFVGIDNYFPLADWRDGEDHLDARAGWPAITDRDYLQANIEGGEGFEWFYASPADRLAQVRTPITDGAHGAPWVFRPKDIRSWWSNPHHDRPGGVESVTPTAWVPKSKPIRFTELGCPAVDRGANQPNVFFDPRSAESALPWFSRGWRDDAMQRAYLEATLGYWQDQANNPESPVYGAPMVQTGESAVWTWDARPYPFFPDLDDVWADGPNWKLGHWLSGRVGTVSLAAVVRDLCRRAGLDASLVDVSGLSGTVDGYTIAALEAPRASIAMLARHFGFDAVESEGRLRFRMRGEGAKLIVAPADMVAAGEASGEDFELTRGQETELPLALKWQLARPDGDYDLAAVEARRITVTSTRIAAESFPLAVPSGEAARRCKRALIEAWAGRESATFRLPPSRLALDPGDAFLLDHDERLRRFRVTSIADGDGRLVTAVGEDDTAADLAPARETTVRPSVPVVYVPPDAFFFDIPALQDDEAEHQPLVAASARPWPGFIAIHGSAAGGGFELVTLLGTRARTGRLLTALPPGPPGRWDHAASVDIALDFGALASVSDIELFGGANLIAIDGPAGVELLQAGTVTLIAPGQYRLRHLLRGLRGTEAAMGAPDGTALVVIDAACARLDVALAAIGNPRQWRIGPAARPPVDVSYTARDFTPQGAGLRPFAPVHLRASRDAVSGDVALRWIRRSRALDADRWEAIEVPLAEDVESYTVEIRDGGAVKRYLTAGTPGVVYTAAMQVADWGAPLGPGDALTFTVRQLSMAVGPGWPATATVTF